MVKTTYRIGVRSEERVIRIANSDRYVIDPGNFSDHEFLKKAVSAWITGEVPVLFLPPGVKLYIIGKE